MYNRYVKNDTGSYSRIPQEEPVTHSASSPPQNKGDPEPVKTNSTPHSSKNAASRKEGIGGIFRGFLDQFHLDNIDTGDLLLLALLFFFFYEDADDELLAALGLLLIL